MMVMKIVFYGAIIVAVTIFIEVTGPSPSFFKSADTVGNTAIWVSLVMLFVELCFYCSRIFRDEIRNRTLSSLVTLPISIPEIVYSKWAGCLLATVPAWGYFFAGVVLSPVDFADFMQDALIEPGFYYTVMQFVVGYHLCTLLSMYIKFGAVAVTVALMVVSTIFMLNTLSALTSGFSSNNEIAVLGCMASMVITVILHLAVIFRMQVMATR